MSVESITGEGYSVEYNPNTKTIAFVGSMRLRTSEEYEPISTLLSKVHDSIIAEGPLLLDFRELKFLNSSGINVISRFTISSRKADKIHLRVIGNKEIYWQKKSLVNLERLWPKVQIEIQ